MPTGTTSLLPQPCAPSGKQRPHYLLGSPAATTRLALFRLLPCSPVQPRHLTHPSLAPPGRLSFRRLLSLSLSLSLSPYLPVRLRVSLAYSHSLAEHALSPPFSARAAHSPALSSLFNVAELFSVLITVGLVRLLGFHARCSAARRGRGCGGTSAGD